MRIHLLPLGFAIAANLALLQAQPSAVAAKQAATTTFLDARAPKDARLAAVARIGYPDPGTMPALLAVGRSRAEDDLIRLEALRLVRWSDEYLDTVLKILDDPEDGGELLDAGLIENLASRATFRLPPRTRQRIQVVLRKLLDDRRDRVRLYAYRSLATNHDTLALSRLTEALRRGRDFPIPLKYAIDLLRIDGSVNYIDTLRPYLDHTDPAVQGRAARALAFDPQSRGRLIGMARSADTAEEVRVQALTGLARADSRFGSYAIALVENVRESPAVRYAAMHTFAGRMNYNSIAPQEQIRFAEAVEAIAGDEKLRAVDNGRITTAAIKLLEHLQRAFPVVRKHYANR